MNLRALLLAAALAVPAVAAVSTTATVARAQIPQASPGKDPKATYSESKDDSGQLVKFKDDPLDGTGLGTTPQIIDGGHRASKQNLLRPRYNFVSELRKSIESM
jgi:hypothetical protein